MPKVASVWARADESQPLVRDPYGNPPPRRVVRFAPAHLGSAPLQRKIEKTQLATAFAELCPFGNRIVSDLRVPLLQSDDKLASCEVHADAAVWAGAESEVMVEVLAVHVELIGGQVATARETVTGTPTERLAALIGGGDTWTVG